MRSIGIIGAGMAGLACAQELSAAGYSVELFDKGRGPSGRMSARRADVSGETIRFDHGAQFFTARDPAFRDQVRRWEETEVVARWPAAGDEAWVGTPAMNAPIRALADALTVHWGVRVESILRDGDSWQLESDGGTFACDVLVCAVPAEQAAELLAAAAPELAMKANTVVSEPCWAFMAGFAKPLDLPDCLNSDSKVVAWAARNSSKPGRDGGENWVIHASPERTRELLDLPRDEVAKMLLDDFFTQTGVEPVWPVHLAAHRWLYARPNVERGGPSCHWDAENSVGICGDYLHSPRVEGAFLSGAALARAILGTAAD